MNIIKIFKYIKTNGISITIKECWKRLINKVFSLLLILGRTDINIDYSSSIKGLSNIKIGKNLYAGKNLWLEAIVRHGDKEYKPLIVIKDNVAINDFVHIGATNYIEIGNNVLMASKIYISDHNHGTYVGDEQSNPSIPPNQRIVNNDQKVIIGDNVWIGEMVSILPGVTIGEGSVIGAGSVVTHDISKYSIAVGNPAKVIKQYNFDINKWTMVK
jgi:lipopolysaccharide O-acetyltransferase